MHPHRSNRSDQSRKVPRGPSGATSEPKVNTIATAIASAERYAIIVDVIALVTILDALRFDGAPAEPWAKRLRFTDSDGILIHRELLCHHLFI